MCILWCAGVTDTLELAIFCALLCQTWHGEFSDCVMRPMLLHKQQFQHEYTFQTIVLAVGFTMASMPLH
jgi:hypothetical protein